MAFVQIPVSGFRLVGRQVETIAPRTLDEVVELIRSRQFVWLDFDLQSAPVQEVQELSILTFITGFYGMNLPNLHGANMGQSVYIIWVLDAIMLGIVGWFLYYFYRKDWL